MVGTNVGLDSSAVEGATVGVAVGSSDSIAVGADVGVSVGSSEDDVGSSVAAFEQRKQNKLLANVKS